MASSAVLPKLMVPFGTVLSNVMVMTVPGTVA